MIQQKSVTNIDKGDDYMVNTKQPSIQYKKGYKYQLHTDYRFKVNIPISREFKSDFLDCDLIGNVHVKKGYAWDGATCAIDTDTFMRGAMIHDVLYQLIREGSISQSYRTKADEILDIVLEYDGMGLFRRFYVKKALALFGSKAADPKSKRKVLVAP